MVKNCSLQTMLKDLSEPAWHKKRTKKMGEVGNECIWICKSQLL